MRMGALMQGAMRQGLYYGLGVFMMKGVSLVMLPIFTHYLTTAEYGRLEVLSALSNLGTLILGFGLVEMLYRFSGSAQSEAQQKSIAAELYGLSVLFGGVALLLLVLLAPWLANALPGQVSEQEMRWLCFAIALEGAIALPLAWLRMRNRAEWFCLLTTVKFVVQALLSWWCLEAGLGIEAVLMAGAVSACAMVVALFALQQRDTGMRLSTKHLRTLLVYGVPVVISGMAAFALSGLDRWLLASYFGEAALASFAVAAKFSAVIILLMQPFTLWWYPRRFSVLNKENGIELNAHYAVLGAVIAILLAGVLGMVAPQLIMHLTPEAYHTAIDYVPWLLLATVVKIISELLNLGCYADQHSRLQMHIHLVSSAVGVLGFALLIPGYGAYGVVMALLTAYSLRLVMFYMLSQRRLYLPYKLLPMYGAACVSCALLVAGQFVV